MVTSIGRSQVNNSPLLRTVSDGTDLETMDEPDGGFTLYLAASGH